MAVFQVTVHVRRGKSELVTQLCPTLCDPMDYNPPGFPVRGIFQARGEIPRNFEKH